MVRSARSRTTAISTRRAPRSARWSVGSPVCLPLGPGKIERGQPSTRQLSEPGNLTGRSERNNLNGLCLRDALQFRGSHWRLVKNHGVCGEATDFATSHIDGLVVLVIAERSQNARGLGRGGLVACDYDSRWRIQIIE